jgi:molybdate transport system substrate-binding protein
MRSLALLALVTLFSPASLAVADTARAAVAANFTTTAEQLAVQFAAETGHELSLSFGATGMLYTQIAQGAPFDVFLAADAVRPSLAVENGLGVGGTVFAYATGSLALYGPSLDLGDGEAVLRDADFRKLAIADPETAPYGRAAMETLGSLGLAEELGPRLVTGENISQALQFVESGNAELGFVAASQVAGQEHVWIVPAGLHQPIEQDAVLLTHGKDNPAAIAFMAFLRSPAAVTLIEAAGYTVH